MALGFRLLVITLLSCWLSDKAHAGWQADDSCGPYVTDVRGGMNSAFANSRAVVALQNNIYFLKAASYLMQINTIRDAVTRHAFVLEWFSVEKRYLSQRWLGSGDVIVYCDFSRFTTTSRKINGQNELVHVNEKMGVTWPHNAVSGKAWDACNGPGWPDTIMAYAIKNSLSYDNKPDEIQLCTWYLRWMYAEKFKLSTAVNPSWLENVQPETQAVLDAFQKTPMDLRTGMLMDRILAHELFHLNHVGMAVDQPGGSGWAYSVQWASVGNNNAENLAQLGFAAQFIQSDKVMPNLAGEIVPLSLD